MQRLGDAPPVDGSIVAIIAAIGVVLNGVSAMLFARGRQGDINMRGAFLHLVVDAVVSAGVVVSGIVVWRTGLAWIDPVVSLIVSVVILRGTWKLLREALNLLLDAVPNHIDAVEVQAYLAALPNVIGVHDLHIWSLSTTETAMTAHLVAPWEKCSPSMLAELSIEMKRRFKIGHVTVQIEPDTVADDCRQATAGAL